MKNCLMNKFHGRKSINNSNNSQMNKTIKLRRWLKRFKNGRLNAKKWKNNFRLMQANYSSNIRQKIKN